MTIEARERGRGGPWVEIARIEGVEPLDLEIDGQVVDRKKPFGIKQFRTFLRTGKVCWKDEEEGPWPIIEPAHVVWLADPQREQPCVVVPAGWLFDAIVRAIEADAPKYSRIRLR